MAIITDIAKFTEEIEKINGIYAKGMSEYGIDSTNQELFFTEIRKLFDDKLSFFEGDPVLLYGSLLKGVYYELMKRRRNLVNKKNKKIIKRRGNLIWDGREGTLRHDDNE
jgi:hypothetical protein